MTTPTPASLVFKVTRREPELVVPAKPTPHELKQLSDIDDHNSIRFFIPMIQFYKHNPAMEGKDPAKVIKGALAQALVFYYPFAGRLKEGAARKLSVDCNGEGVLFIEADADVTLDQFGDVVLPPFPCLEELIYDVPPSQGIFGSPLLLIQVTRLKCGGFILGLNHNHALCDLKGLVQFLTAAAEIAHGAHAPSFLPVWQRELLNARNPPHVTCTHKGFNLVPGTHAVPVPHAETTHLSFVFRPAEVSALRRLLPPHLQKCSDFELLTACLWHCRVAALQINSKEDVSMIVLVDSRSTFNNPPLPSGFYGNALAFSTAATTAGELRRKPLEHGVEQVRKAVADVTEEYMRSFADFMVINDRPHFSLVRSFLLMDLRGVGLEDVDFGWGKPAYGGAPGAMHGVSSFFMGFKDGVSGEEGIVVPICLPSPAMKRFVNELNSLLGLVKHDDTVVG